MQDDAGQHIRSSLGMVAFSILYHDSDTAPAGSSLSPGAFLLVESD
jgi:hypothetical protein